MYRSLALTEPGNVAIVKNGHHGRNTVGNRKCSKTRSLMCRYCGKKYKRKTTVKKHERTHPGEKPFQCSYCVKAFTRAQTLKYHERTHTGERPHQCRYCGKAYVQSGTLKNHEKNTYRKKAFSMQFL